jgi:hypothetical protein
MLEICNDALSAVIGGAGDAYQATGLKENCDWLNDTIPKREALAEKAKNDPGNPANAKWRLLISELPSLRRELEDAKLKGCK